MSTRLVDTFAALKADGHKGLVGYLTAGDPDAVTSEQNIRAALDAGVDVLELGVPFSDPTADGPTIQAASTRALASGMTVCGVLELVKRLRADYDVPIILFGYANPFFTYGYEAMAKDAASAGVDGFLVVDLPHEEADEFRSFLRAHDLAFIPLIAPTTDAPRAARILGKASGFVYYITVTGVTGARTEVAKDLQSQVEALKGLTDLPVAVGFGVSSGEQAAEAGAAADAVVVGSALVQAALDGRVTELVTELSEALR